MFYNFNMSTNIKTLFDFINKSNSLFIGPYHRGYSWTEFDCSEFFNSAFDNNIKSLDFGIISLKKTGGLNYILVDGYQRLITLLIFVQALVKSKKVKFSDKNKPTNFLVSINSDGDEVFKLKINNNDKNDIEKIIKNDFLEKEIRNENFITNYKYFEKKLEEKNVPIFELLTNISKIKFSISMIESETNDEFLYFNSNKNFTQLDLIRNYVYSVLKDSGQLHIFSTYWLEVEKKLGNLQENFLIDYITIQQNGSIPKKEELFTSFVLFVDKMIKLKQRDDIIKQLYRYSNYYLKIVRSDIHDSSLKQKLEYINSFEAKDTYPYLMEVFEDYDFAHINKHMLLDILDTVITFVDQREKCPSSPIAVNFAALSKDINRMLVLKNFMPKIITQISEDIELGNEHVQPKRLTINDLIKNKSTN